LQQRRHAFPHAAVANFDHARPGLDQLRDGWGADQEFVNANASFIADVAALGAPDSAINFKVGIVFNPQLVDHVVSNRMVTLTGPASAEGSSYVVTLINDKEAGPQTLSISRYLDKYVKAGGQWRISRREIILESGNQALGRKYGFIPQNPPNAARP
jgi:hypothetical protein